MPARSHPTRVDLYRELRDEYVAPRSPKLVRVRRAKYLSVQGRGAPGSDEFQRRLSALFSVAYTVKFQEKARGRDFRMLMLEGLYDLPVPGAAGSPSVPMGWTLLLRVPTSLRPGTLRQAVRTLRGKGKPSEVEEVQLRWLREGTTVQMLHVGPYNAEEPSLREMRAFAGDHHLRLAGAHHEIYLSDPRRVEESRYRTILRYPVAPAA